MSPKPLLFIDSAAARGGAEQSLLQLLLHLDPHLWQPHLVCTADSLAESAQEAGILVQQLPLQKLRRSWRFPLDWTRQARRLADLASTTGAQALVANNVRAALYASLAAKIAGRPFIWHMRDFWLGENKPRFRLVDTILKIILCKAATRVIANSEAVAARLPCPRKVTVVHNGLDPAHFIPLAERDIQFRRALERSLGLVETAVLVGMAGRLRPWKGQRVFLQMARLVKAEFPGVAFVVIGGAPFGGDSDYEQELRSAATAADLAGTVYFTGHLADVRPALAALDIFVHPGEPEPFGLVNIEVMAMGKPVVAFAHGALPEIVLSAQTGLLTPPGDIPLLAAAVGQLINDPVRRAQMGGAGRRRVQERFTIQQTAAGVSAILHAIMEPPP